jgi:hypothetical protein
MFGANGGAKFEITLPTNADAQAILENLSSINHHFPPSDCLCEVDFSL